jgi:hypothetical protein
VLKLIIATLAVICCVVEVKSAQELIPSKVEVVKLEKGAFSLKRNGEHLEFKIDRRTPP